ncbi:DTW domain-containing protein [Oceanimonas pelagia]|uniref:tRNA-uridine aminocarboxypropyltransferase n=1 Tax=Oceanimonas pelagia TaxID=3028314 RepID=A0AA50QBC9_9GAMM|nr:tRNA-uridine aminocarboxypropyltransferase [Oceanimonas pelagia]WMC09986.1 DTW domain-containing protein [Oceanimonas pelagia]
MSRATCPRCRLPARTCLCAHVHPQACPLPVIILQHPLEARHAKSTVPLLQLALPELQRVVAEHMTPPPPLPRGRWWLLYPNDKAADIDSTAPAHLDIGGLIVLDGTWRKTRRLHHLNPWLNDLPALSFSQAPASRYTMRKGPGGQALSTLESLAHVLDRLSPGFDPAPLHHLLAHRVAQFHAGGRDET